MSGKVLVLKAGDNVAIAVGGLRKGEAVEGAGGELRARIDVPRNHKVAIKRIEKGAAVIKHGESIGFAGETIEAGEWVHTHNLKSEEGR